MAVRRGTVTRCGILFTRLACESPGAVNLQRARERRPGHRPGLGERVQLSAGAGELRVVGARCAAGGSLPAMKLAFALMAAINGSTGSWATLSSGLQLPHHASPALARRHQGFSSFRGGGASAARDAVLLLSEEEVIVVPSDGGGQVRPGGCRWSLRGRSRSRLQGITRWSPQRRTRMRCYSRLCVGWARANDARRRERPSAFSAEAVDAVCEAGRLVLHDALQLEHLGRRFTPPRAWPLLNLRLRGMRAGCAAAAWR
jgi:hypothetical protein